MKFLVNMLFNKNTVKCNLLERKWTLTKYVFYENFQEHYELFLYVLERWFPTGGATTPFFMRSANVIWKTNFIIILFMYLSLIHIYFDYPDNVLLFVKIV